MAGTDTITSGTQAAGGWYRRATNGKSRKPILEKTKSVSYSATQSDQIFAISNTASSSTKESMPDKVEIENNGMVPIMIMAGYETYTDDTTDGATEYLHTMLMPGDVYSPPVRGVIATGADTVIVDGTVVDSQAPDANEYVNVSAYIDGSGLASGTTATTFDVDDNEGSPAAAVGFFRVGDLIRIENEILEVTAIAANTGTEAQLTVRRGINGSTAATHADDVQIRLPFFNAYTNTLTSRSTDASGRFKAMNFFGLGRANTEVQGLTPGSIALKFYEPGYQEFGMSGITASTNSGLSASTTYYLSISIDGATTDKITFTTDSSNVNFGGANGIVSKLQAAIDALYYNPAKNGFEKGAKVEIVNGDIRVTSSQRLSTSAISITTNTDGASGTDELFDTSNTIGRIPATIKAAVAAKLPDDVIYDPITYTAKPNTGVFVYDDGNGRLFGAANGSINYETGAINIINAPANAEFVVSCIHTSAFSGKATPSEADRINTLVDIYANTPSTKWNGSVKVRTF